MDRFHGFFVFVLLIGAMSVLPAQAPEWLWASTAGGAAWDNAADISCDQWGNLYIAGMFEDSAQFGDATLTSYGSRDVLIAKLDPNGNWLWQLNAGGSSAEYGSAIVASDSYLYVTGMFFGASTFGPVSYTSEGSSDMFVAILDFDGTWDAVDRSWGTGDCISYDLKLNAEEDIYLTGQIMGEVELGATTLDCSGTNNRDIFVTKLDRTGTWEWAVQAGAAGTTPDYAVDLALDDAENIYIAGAFFGAAQFGSTVLTSYGAEDIFLAKLDPDGNWLWAVQAGGTSSDNCDSMVRDAEGNLILAGRFRGTATFGTHTLVCSGQENAFLAKAGPNGNWLWAIPLVGANCTGLTTDSASNIYATGSFWQPLNLGNYIQTHGGVDLYAAKLDSSGDWLWARGDGAYGQFSSSQGLGVALNPAGNPCIAGSTMGNAFFNALDGDEFEMCFGEEDIAVAEINEYTPVEDDLATGPEGVSGLGNAFPNPVRAGSPATLRAWIKAGESGELTIFNLRGQTVCKRQLSPGTQEISLDTGSLPAGLYLCRLHTPSQLQTRKLVVLK
ncbi:MAG TPA: T9SS type A sorting domain-containing protein [Candidatus Syntrophosphaera sp.]|nr:T9SS type A sorting domain-containing protein [Candidatus Syntrophosphaera sp.]